VADVAGVRFDELMSETCPKCGDRVAYDAAGEYRYDFTPPGNLRLEQLIAERGEHLMVWYCPGGLCDDAWGVTPGVAIVEEDEGARRPGCPVCGMWAWVGSPAQLRDELDYREEPDELARIDELAAAHGSDVELWACLGLGGCSNARPPAEWIGVGPLPRDPL